MSRAALEAVIGRYFDALHHSDADLMAAVMHPEMVYATADETEPLIRRLPAYLDVLRARESPASRGEARADAIESIEMAGDNIASARVRCAIGERRFTDFLSLIRTGGEWRIIAKVFAIRFEPAEK